jgi:hypothetical protein
MKLIFKIGKNDHLEILLGIKQYGRLWEQHGDKIIEAFYRQTGLRFTQKQLTVRCIDSGPSFSGSRNQPMRLSIRYTNDDDRLVVFTHELGHRLLASHGLRVRYKNEDKFLLEGHMG